MKNQTEEPSLENLRQQLHTLSEDNLPEQTRQAIQSSLQILETALSQGGNTDENTLRQILAVQTALIAENIRLYAAMRDMEQEKAKFVSVVSHELRLPMTSIKGYTDLLLQGMVGPINEQQTQFLEVIRNNVERMQALVSNLSDISRLETGRLRLNRGAFQLSESVAQVMSSLGEKITAKKQTYELNIPDNLPDCYADAKRAAQVLSNLISNAWKYTPEGGHISISAQARDEHVYVEVADTGIGILPADQTKIFTPFFRSEEDAVRQQPGWGLGLHLAKRLVDVMGGSMGFHSKPGAGSTFWFTLPISKTTPENKTANR